MFELADIKIVYCGIWHYKAEATRVVDIIHKTFPALDDCIELIRLDNESAFKEAWDGYWVDGGGVFDVIVDDKVIFSRKERKEFLNNSPDGTFVNLFPDERELIVDLQENIIGI